VYFVMVIAPLFVVKVNWACTTAGSANSNSSGSNFVAARILMAWVFIFFLSVCGDSAWAKSSR